jgi:hypothetical protein
MAERMDSRGQAFANLKQQTNKKKMKQLLISITLFTAAMGCATERKGK